MFSCVYEKEQIQDINACRTTRSEGGVSRRILIAEVKQHYTTVQNSTTHVALQDNNYDIIRTHVISSMGQSTPATIPGKFHSSIRDYDRRSTYKFEFPEG